MGRRVASLDERLSATVVRRVPLLYSAGEDEREDRPAHVRAGSGLARCGDKLAIVQDDANFVALFDPATERVEAVALPRGASGRRQFDDARGNKAEKLDLESCVVLPSPAGDWLVAFGSGSSRQRERGGSCRVGTGGSGVRVVDAPPL